MSYLKQLIELGVLVEPNVANDLNKLENQDFEKMIDFVKIEKPLVISREVLEKFLKKSEFRIIKNFNPVKKYEIQDYVTMLNNRYNSLQDILIKKVELQNVISINKAKVGKISVIGMIKEMNDKIEIEDPTGTLQLSVENNNFSKDDVIAVTGNITNGTIVAEKIIYPDVPLRPVNYSSKDLVIGESGDYIISKDKLVDNVKNKTYEINNPCLIQIDSLVILIAFGFNPLEFLKKRYVQKDNTDFILDSIPDIIFSDIGENSNYKGISIVTKGSINLKTRELIQ
ncbi:MAG: hypothetical protein ACXACX_09300 [Candidatus Hodarchaeales archaeon]|jgi:hypothetical protein